VTCDDVRERLPEHLLGTLQGEAELEVRRHLRGCAGCRAEMVRLGDGLTTFARAVHDREPPKELRERVLTVLEDEWRDHPIVVPVARPRRLRWLAAAAALVALAASIGWGISQTNRANLAADDARSYNRILSILGGEDFRVGRLQAVGSQVVEGSVVLYDAHTDQSWGLVILRAPGLTGKGFHATLWTTDGRRIPFFPMQLDEGGDGSGWLVTGADLRSFSSLTLTSPDGALLARATIQSV
jgi:predicted anti-sigma-YlaC factor YlaD